MTYHIGVSQAIYNRVQKINGAELVACEKVKKGGNNGLFHLVYSNNDQYALKLYPPLSMDPRRRLKVEYSTLSFLNQHGEKHVPAPVAALEEHNAGIYEWIAGDSVQWIKTQDMAEVLHFMQRLHCYKEQPAAKMLPFASEAYFSYEQAKRQLQQRMKRLYAQADYAPELKNYLQDRFEPAERKLLGYLEKSLLNHIESRPPSLILSPSDLGFHNALKQANGDLVFVDFEYFGWDDAAKLMADFLWHPGMSLSDELKQQFVDGALTIYNDKELLQRFKILYVLCGLRWCLIMLNEFLPEGMNKRKLSGQMEPADNEKILAQQLHKAETTLAALLDTYDKNTYMN